MKTEPPEFLFDAMHAPQMACGNHEVSANPVKVMLEAPKKTPVPRRDQTEDEREAVKCLKEQVTYPPASWDKRFARDLLTTTITHEDKKRLLEVAERLAAPDLRKLAKEAEERQRIATTKA